VLVVYCEAWSRFVAAVKQYRAEGVTKLNPDSGRTGKHAAVAVAENAAVQLAKLGGLLGLSPVAERGLGSFHPPDDVDDPYAG
jgi:P27 family predicted phage terminase small subunit